VVLPAPLGPSKPVIQPSSAMNDRSSTAVKPLKRLLTLSSSIMYIPCAVPAAADGGRSGRIGSTGTDTFLTGHVEEQGRSQPSLSSGRLEHEGEHVAHAADFDGAAVGDPRLILEFFGRFH